MIILKAIEKLYNLKEIEKVFVRHMQNMEFMMKNKLSLSWLFKMQNI